MPVLAGFQQGAKFGWHSRPALLACAGAPSPAPGCMSREAAQAPTQSADEGRSCTIRLARLPKQASKRVVYDVCVQAGGPVPAGRRTAGAAAALQPVRAQGTSRSCASMRRPAPAASQPSASTPAWCGQGCRWLPSQMGHQGRCKPQLARQSAPRLRREPPSTQRQCFQGHCACTASPCKWSWRRERERPPGSAQAIHSAQHAVLSYTAQALSCCGRACPSDELLSSVAHWCQRLEFCRKLVSAQTAHGPAGRACMQAQ